MDHFKLISLYHTNKDDLQYLKKIEYNQSLMEYFGTLMIYVGKDYAYLIKQYDEYIVFLFIANDPYQHTREINKEIYLIIDEEYQHKGLATLVLNEVTEYLLTIANWSLEMPTYLQYVNPFRI